MQGHITAPQVAKTGKLSAMQSRLTSSNWPRGLRAGNHLIAVAAFAFPIYAQATSLVSDHLRAEDTGEPPGFVVQDDRRIENSFSERII